MLAAAAAAAMLAVAALAGLVGCAPSGPSKQQLRAALIEAVRQDDLAYNQRMDRWGAPQPEPDGSSFSVVRSHRELAVKPAALAIRNTGGHTTIYAADVPRAITTYIKTGTTEQECLAAPERRLEPQPVTNKYEYDVVRQRWHEVEFGAPGGLLGM